MSEELQIFNDQVRLYGRHAQRVYHLTKYIEPQKKTKLFPTNISVYKNAALIGFLYGRKADLNHDKDENGKVYSQNIMDKQVIDASKELEFNMRMILMLDKKHEPDPAKRLDKALRNLGKDPEDIELFDQYTRGGIDVMYEKLCADAGSPEQYMQNVFDFIEDFDELFNEGISREDVLELSRGE